MFDEARWEAMSFSFMLFDTHYRKDSGTMDWEINDVMYEYEYGETAIPSLIMTLEDEAPGVLGPV